jgi:6-phosphogluconolactonase (cycloisomerase 2 family)
MGFLKSFRKESAPEGRIGELPAGGRSLFARAEPLRRLLPALLIPALALAGCGKFFPPLTSTGTGTGSGSGTGTSSFGDFLYVGNLGTNPLTIAGFSLANGALTVPSGFPVQVTLEPTALAVTPNDDYLYAGSVAGGIYVFSISSGGNLTLANGGAPVATGVEPSVLRVDPTGNFLLGADAFAGEAYVFQIGSGGSLNSLSSSIVPLNASTPATDLEISPSGSLVFVSCGTAGIYTLSFNTSTGALAQVNGVLNPKQSGDADYGMAVTPNGTYLLAAETGISSVRVFSISPSGGLNEASGSPVKTGTGPDAVLIDSTGSYVYVTNRTDGTISGFGISATGALTPVTGSPFSTGKLPSAMVEDKTDAYIAVLNSGGNPDLQVFKFTSTTGALASLATATTGTDPTSAASIAGTH